MQAIDPKLNFIGFRPTGDLANLTCYTSKRNRVVWFPKAPPQKPPSILQIRNRDRFRLAAMAWNSLQQNQRDDWHTAARRARLILNGYTLWVYWQLTRDRAAILTLERLTQTDLLPN